ncbi:hypothetical protein V1477_007768 [Vespula maculifrons]|uniref:Uncharacterized protein n=1 Tax=Vespula maculifrons TaxID=7453 RepID=A0ABD2CFP1_VESMC
MVVGKLFTKLIQTLPSWETTKYYGRVCICQLRCIKYKMQTSKTWFNFKCKFMPYSFRKELKCKECHQNNGEAKEAVKSKKDCSN